MSIFNDYTISHDEMFDEQKRIKTHWRQIYDAILKAGVDELRRRQSEIDWTLEDNGVTYNIYNDPNGNNRPWKLDPIPFVIDGSEWNKIESGLQQRAKLLDLIFKDLYNDQLLLKNNIIPSEVVFGHKGFLPELFRLKKGNPYDLIFYAADMGRGPDGNMWIINDKTQAPSGLGYVIENRLTMNKISKDLFGEVPINRLYDFVNSFGKVLKSSSPLENPLMVLLTPGPHNETYFEHSFLSSFMDLVLVQGEDLLSKNGSIYLKSLSGLRRVDTILRRVDDQFCDPLELKSDSKLGVSGLVDVLRHGGVSMINPLGSGVLENVGLNPFMENICKYFLNESLILPQIATWWCGQKSEFAFVSANMDKLIIKKIDKTQSNQTYFGSKLSSLEKEALIKEIKKAPYLYVGQEEVSFSCVPSFSNETIEPRSASIRAFAIKKDDNYDVMPGGLVRVSSSIDSPIVSNQKGGVSKDLWIFGDSNFQFQQNILKSRLSHDTSFVYIPTLKAENLFWLGRYLNRTLVNARMIRHCVKSVTNFNNLDESSQKVSHILNRALTHLTMTYLGFLDSEREDELKKNPLPEILSIIKDQNRVGSLSYTFNMLVNVQLNTKELLSLDAIRVFEKMRRDFLRFCATNTNSQRAILDEMDKFVIHLVAFKELIKESMFLEQGVVLYDVGFKIESSMLLISKLRSLMTFKLEKSVEYDVLESLLNSCESFNAFRAHARTSLNSKDVLEFMLLNMKFPKSLIHRLQELQKDFTKLPKTKQNSYLNSYEEPIFRAFSTLRLSDIGDVYADHDKFVYEKLDMLLASLSEMLLNSAQNLSHTYFAHYDE